MGEYGEHADNVQTNRTDAVWSEFGQSVEAKRNFLEEHIVGQYGFSAMGIGVVKMERWGFTWWKPTLPEMHLPEMQKCWKRLSSSMPIPS